MFKLLCRRRVRVSGVGANAAAVSRNGVAGTCRILQSTSHQNTCCPRVHSSRRHRFLQITRRTISNIDAATKPVYPCSPPWTTSAEAPSARISNKPASMLTDVLSLEPP
jgi:hypothetical protein